MFSRQVSWVLGLMIMVATAGRAGEPPRVLILFSNDRLLPANQRYDGGIRKALDPQGKQADVSFYSEFLDATRLGGAEREAAMEDYLSRRYEERPPHVLVALGPEALRFLLDRRKTLFPDVPLVFGGSSAEELEPIHSLEGVAGLPMELRLTPVVEALLKMRPQTKEIVLVHGVAEADRSWRDVALRQCEALAGRVKVTSFPELPLPELKAGLAGLSSEKAVLYLTYFQGPGGETYTPAHVAPEIAEASAVPVIGPYDTYIGSGVLGVSVSPFEEEGMALGKVVRRVLDGEKAESIGVLSPSHPRLILDDRVLKRWRIKTVPVGAEVRHRTPTLWEEHRSAVVATATVLALQSLLITGLILARRRQKRAEKELRSSEARFSGVFRGSPTAISILRQSDGRIVDVNPVWEAVTGVRREDAIGLTPLETGMISAGDDAEDRFRLFLESGKPLKDYEQAHRTPDGRTRVLSVSTELITLHDEACFIIVAKDVTDTRMEERARQELAKTSRLALLGELTASIAHEVNQPLGAILSNTDAAEMLLEQPVPPLEEVRLILSDIRRDDLRASAVIRRVRAMVGRREIQQAPLNLNELLLESLKLINHDARRRGVAVVHELADDLPEVLADAGQIEQVMLNLLLNSMDAMKDTPLASRQIVIRTALREDSCVQASVEDCGHGIPPDKISRVFDSFFTTKEGGMGLGLAMARSIAEAHGGALFAENNASMGAVFHLILPTHSSTSHDDTGSRSSGRSSH